MTEELIEAAGYEPVYAGGLENAAGLEDFVGKVMLPTLTEFGYSVREPRINEKWRALRRTLQQIPTILI